jgi:hypothetical protein
LILHSDKCRDNTEEKMKRQSISVIIVLSLLIGFTAPFAQAADRYSVANGNWNSTSTWSATSGGASGVSVPGASDNVYIERGYTVTIAAAPTNGTIASLTIGGTTAGTLDIHPAASGSYTVTVSGDVIINSNGSFTVTNYSNYNYHTINIGGNLTVDGTFNMTTTIDDHATVVFNGSAQQTISGAGTTCTFYSLTASNTSTTGLVLNRNIVLAVSGSQTATDLTVTANDIFDLGSYTCDRSTSGGGTVAVNAGATLKIGGTNTFPSNYTANTLNATSTVEYYGTTQTVGALTYGNLTLSGSDVKTLAGTTSIVGDLTVSAGTFDLSTYTANRSAAGGTLTVSNGASLKIGGTGTIPSNYSTHSIGSTSTIEYAGTNQSVAVLNSAQNYGNLAISGSGTKTLAGSETVDGTLSQQGTATFSLGGSTLTYGASASLEYNGSAAQTTGPELPSSIASGQTVIVNNGNGVSLGAATTINGTLTMTQGTLHLSSYNLTIGSSGSIGGSSSSYVVTDGSGVLTRNAVGAGDVLFPVGTGSAYNPVTINNTGTSDNFSVSLKSSFDHTPSNANYVNCQWTITEAGTGGNATITLQWNATDEHTGFDRANPIYIGRWNGTQWVQTSATLGGGGPYTATASNFTSFSPFGVGNDGALPIQLASFAASVVRDNDVEVTWKTVSETNNYGFEVYRKRDGTDDWLKIAFVNGHGTTLAPQSYSYTDRSVPFGKYYYRIKQIDLDGKSETFPEMEVAIGVAPGAFVLAQNYPNPFNPTTTIEFAVPQNGRAALKVYNVLGQEVTTLFEGSLEAGRINTVRFDASNLPSGLYFYTLRTGGKVETKRMLLLK